jgi:hypothetical protein
MDAEPKALSEALAAARAQVAEGARELEALRYRLLGAKASLPAGPAETLYWLEAEEMNPVSEIRGRIDCILRDFLEPALRDLRGIAAGETHFPEKEAYHHGS